MSFVSNFREGVAGWVHENARLNPLEYARHADFISTRLAASLAPLALAPAYLALRGSADLWEVLIFVCAAIPLASVYILSRTGNFVAAQSMSIIGLLATAIVLSFGLGGISAAALVWLVLAPVEAVFAFSAPLVIATIFGSFATLGLITLGAGLGYMPRDGGAGLVLHGFFVAPAVLYIGAVTLGSMRLLDQRRKRENVGAARFDTLAGAMGDQVLRLDRSGAVVFASRESQNSLNASPGDLMGRGLFERVLVQDRPAFLKAVSDAATSSDTARCELRLRGNGPSDGRDDFNAPVFLWVELRARRLRHRGAELEEQDGACVLAVLRDLSREKAREAQLESARLEAERSSAWKDRFIANVSHELRTPLNAIIGFSEILGNADLVPADPARRKEYADIIHVSGQHLLSVVNSILDISKLEAGRFDIVCEPFEVAPLIDSCFGMVSLRATQAEIEMTRSDCEDFGEIVGDKRACKQILLNLLSNAIKFTPKGGRVSVGVRPEGANIALEVADTGVGIPAAEMTRLGEVFFQAGGAAINRQFEGTGLGLSIVHGLVGLHGGAMTIESGQGEGTCVTIRLPRDGAQVQIRRRATTPIETITRIGPARRDPIGREPDYALKINPQDQITPHDQINPQDQINLQKKVKKIA